MNIRIYFSAFIFLFLFSGLRAGAATNTTGTPGALPSSEVIAGNIPSDETIANMSKEQKEARMAIMKERVKEIKAMDKSKMTKQERKALRVELRNMNKEARSMGYNGVYISVGALIIIILLLILILR
jgi:hypothetical protein